MRHSITPASVESERIVNADPFQLTKADAIRCLQGAIEAFKGAHQMTTETLAETICGVSQGHFSKVTLGQQGDLLAFVYEKLPASIRQDFLERLRELEDDDAYGQALQSLELLLLAAFRVVKTQRRDRLPEKAAAIARAIGAELDRKATA